MHSENDQMEMTLCSLLHGTPAQINTSNAMEDYDAVLQRRLSTTPLKQFAFNPSVLDENNMLIRVSPWNMCESGTAAAKARRLTSAPGNENLYKMVWLVKGQVRPTAILSALLASSYTLRHVR